MLHGDIEEAICHHALFYAIWKKYDCLPERYNWMLRMPDVKFYPLRPELVESTYLLYQVRTSKKSDHSEKFETFLTQNLAKKRHHFRRPRTPSTSTWARTSWRA